MTSHDLPEYDFQFLESLQEKDEVISRLRSALQFYQDEWKAKINKKYGGLEFSPSEELLNDCGNRARDSLIASTIVDMAITKKLQDATNAAMEKTNVK